MSNPKTSKILFLKRSICKNGGLEKATKTLFQAFSNRGCDIHLASLEDASYPSVTNHKLLTPSNLLKYKKICSFDKECQKLIKAHHFDTIFGVEQTSKQTHYRAGNGCHKSYLQLRKKTEGSLKGLSFKLNPLHNLLLKIEKNAFESPELKCLFTNSYMVKNQILENYNVKESKIHVIHNGVEWKKFNKPFIAPPPYQELNINPNVSKLLFIGHNYQRKGLDYLLQALANIDTPFHLSVVGRDKNISYYKKLCSKLKLLDKVTFFGDQLNTIPFYQCADIVVIPSIYDPFANVTVEALAMGCFVISSKTNGGHEILTKNTGIIIDNLNNKEEWVEILKLTLKNTYNRLSIRNSIEHLDYQKQLDKLVTKTLA